MELKNEKKLTYTWEMKEQDFLWWQENEDNDILRRLYTQIIEEARKLGFDAYTEFYEFATGLCCEIYNTLEAYEFFKDKEVYERRPNFNCQYCSDLIEKIEKYYLNRQ